MPKGGGALSANRNISLLITTMISYVLLPVLVDFIADINTTGWDFTGYAGAIVLMNLAPFIWVAGITIATVLAFLGKI